MAINSIEDVLNRVVDPSVINIHVLRPLIEDAPNGDALFLRASQLIIGYGQVPIDPVMYEDLLEQGTIIGDRRCKAAYAIARFHGHGYEKDEAMGIKLASESAKWLADNTYQSNANASLLNLVGHYSLTKGILTPAATKLSGIHHDPLRAADFFLRAGKNGDPNGWYNYAMVKLEIGGDVNLSNIREWFLEAAKSQHANAQYQLGCMASDEGRDEEAREWWEAAGNQGHREAQANLGEWYAAVAIHSEYEEIAFSWCLNAAKQGHVDATWKAAELLACGKGTEKDRNAAAQWCTQLLKHNGKTFKTPRLDDEERGLTKELRKAIRNNTALPTMVRPSLNTLKR